MTWNNIQEGRGDQVWLQLYLDCTEPSPWHRKPRFQSLLLLCNFPPMWFCSYHSMSLKTSPFS